jgi:hypothetical protein
MHNRLGFHGEPTRFFEQTLHWECAPFGSGLAIVIPIVGWRDFRNERRFQNALLLLGVVQLPRVSVLRPRMEQLKFPVVFSSGRFDCGLVALAISWVCSDKRV